MKQIPPFRNRIDVFYLVHEEPSKESENGIYIVKPKDNSYRAIWAVVWGIPLKLISTADTYTTSQIDSIIKSLSDKDSVLEKDISKIKNDIETMYQNLSSLTIRKVYSSKEQMISDKNPIGDDGKPLPNGSIVSVTDENDLDYNGLYLYFEKEWIYLNSNNLNIKQSLGGDENSTISQKHITSIINDIRGFSLTDKGVIQKNYILSKTYSTPRPSEGYSCTSHIIRESGLDITIEGFANEQTSICNYYDKYLAFIGYYDNGNKIGKQRVTIPASELDKLNVKYIRACFRNDQIDSMQAYVDIISNVNLNTINNNLHTKIERGYIGVEKMKNLPITNAPTFILDIWTDTGIKNDTYLTLARNKAKDIFIGFSESKDLENWSHYSYIISENERRTGTGIIVCTSPNGAESISLLLNWDEIFESIFTGNGARLLEADKISHFKGSTYSETLSEFSERINNNVAEHKVILNDISKAKYGRPFPIELDKKPEWLLSIWKKEGAVIEDTYLIIARNVESGGVYTPNILIGFSDYKIADKWSYKYSEIPDKPFTGIKEITLIGLGGKDNFSMLIDWDIINGKNITYYNDKAIPLKGDLILDDKDAYGNTLSKRIEEIASNVKTNTDDIFELKNSSIGDKALYEFPFVNIKDKPEWMLDFWVEPNDVIPQNFYLTNAKNLVSEITVIIGFSYDKTNKNWCSVYSQVRDDLRTGQSWVSCYPAGEYGFRSHVLVDWDILNNINEVTTGAAAIEMDKDKVQTKKGMHNSIREIIGEANKDITDIKHTLDGLLTNSSPAIDTFGDVLPASFISKINNSEEDVLISVQGDSLIGLQNASGAMEDAPYLPPCCEYAHFSTQLWNRICFNKPLCDRYDSTKFKYDFTGEWKTINSLSSNSKFDTPNVSGEWSFGALSYESSSDDASVIYSIDTNEFTKHTFVSAKHPDGASIKFKVDSDIGSNGIFEVSIDRTNWTDLNEFEFNCNSNPNKLSDSECSDKGLALHLRAFRLWIRAKKKTAAKITVTKTADGFFYFWGTEKWNGASIFFDWLGRGGRDVNRLARNISDVISRNPDLILYSMPLANELHSWSWSKVKLEYENTFIDEEFDRGFRKLTNQYEIPLCIILPHGRASYWDKNTQIFPSKWVESVKDILPYSKSKKIFELLKSQNVKGLSFVNLQDALINEALYKYDSIEEGFSSGNLTSDGIHLNKECSFLWAKYIAPLFLK